MQIGTLTLELVKPEKLDEQLVAATGCSAAEILGQLPRTAIASTLAAALIPFVKDPPPRQQLAEAIARDGVIAVRDRIRQLYETELGIEPPEVPEHLRRVAAAPRTNPAAASRKKRSRASGKAKG